MRRVRLPLYLGYDSRGRINRNIDICRLNNHAYKLVYNQNQSLYYFASLGIGLGGYTKRQLKYLFTDLNHDTKKRKIIINQMILCKVFSKIEKIDRPLYDYFYSIIFGSTYISPKKILLGKKVNNQLHIKIDLKHELLKNKINAKIQHDRDFSPWLAGSPAYEPHSKNVKKFQDPQKFIKRLNQDLTK